MHALGSGELKLSDTFHTPSNDRFLLGLVTDCSSNATNCSRVWMLKQRNWSRCKRTSTGRLPTQQLARCRFTRTTRTNPRGNGATKSRNFGVACVVFNPLMLRSKRAYLDFSPQLSRTTVKPFESTRNSAFSTYSATRKPHSPSLGSMFAESFVDPRKAAAEVAAITVEDLDRAFRAAEMTQRGQLHKSKVRRAFGWPCASMDA